MLIKKPKLREPKNKKFVIRRQIWKIRDRERGGLRGGSVQMEADPPGCSVFLYTCHSLKTSWGLKASWRGVIRPSCCKTKQTPTIPPSIIAYIDHNRGWYHYHLNTLHYTLPHLITYYHCPSFFNYYLVYFIIIVYFNDLCCHVVLHICVCTYLYLLSLVLLVLSGCWGTQPKNCTLV